MATTLRSAVLYYNDLATGGSSDKEYRIQLTRNTIAGGHMVQFQYGRRGGTLLDGVKTKMPVSHDEATKIFEKVLNEKLSGGYVRADNAGDQTPTPVANPSARTKYPVELLKEISEKEADRLVLDDDYAIEVKSDGHRRQAEKLSDGSIVSYNKKGEAKPFPPEVEAEFKTLRGNTFFFDGELVGTNYHAFDLLELDGVPIAQVSNERRRVHMTAILRDAKCKLISPVRRWDTRKAKLEAIGILKANRAEGAVFKRKDAPYGAGRNSGHFKYKFVKSVTCRVVMVGTKGHNNATLALLKNGEWVNVGGASMIGKDKRIKVGSLVEVEFLYVGAGGRLYQPRIKELREDVTEEECTWAQLKHAWKEGIEAA